MSASYEWAQDCLRYRGKVLTGKFSHWCDEWDGLPVDETTAEFDCCLCFKDKNGKSKVQQKRK